MIVSALRKKLVFDLFLNMETPLNVLSDEVIH